jgi:phage replication O-like protein O
MASPQKENGYTPIAHTILEQLSKRVISPDEWRILMIIFRKTYGWDKKEDCISHTQFSEMSGIPRNHVPRVLKKLLARNIIYRVSPNQGTGVPHSRDTYIIKYGFQKNFDKWVGWVSPKRVSPNQDKGVPQSGPKVSPKRGHTKDITTKETITKEINHCVKTFIDFYFEEFKTRFGKPPIIEGGKDGNLIKGLLNHITLEDLKGLLTKFFDSTDKFTLGSGYTIGVFKSQINKLQIGPIKQGLFKPQPGIASWYDRKEQEEKDGA